MALRKGQKELVEQYKGGFCAVPAIPGGGKTYCLSLWAAEMISQTLHKPGKILIVTYMNSAVNNFEQRISSELLSRGITSGRDYFVSTIHGLCLQIIKEKPDRISADEEFEIIDGATKVHIISSAIDDWRKKNEEAFRYYIDSGNLSASRVHETYKNWQDKLCSVMMTAIGDFKCNGIDPKTALDRCSAMSPYSLLRWAADIYEIYDRKIKMNAFLDFDDMLFNAKRMLLEDPLLLQKFRKKYSFVCEDEAQDSNKIQSDILSLIANGNFLRVGDSNQAICGSFSNSDFKLFKSFCESGDTVTYNITQSSRNTKEIIGLANHFVSYVRESHPVPECRNSLLPQFIEPVGEDDERRNPSIDEYGIKVGVFSSWENEASSVVRHARHMLETHPDKTMAILIPSSWKISQVVKILEAGEIPYEELDNTSGERTKTVKLLGRILDFVSKPESGEKFAAMMLECFLTDRYEEKPAEEGKPLPEKQKDVLRRFLHTYPVEDLLYPRGGELEVSKIPRELLNLKIWEDFAGKLDTVRELLEFPFTVIEKLILYISEKLRFDREERAIAQKVAGDVRYLMSQDPRWRLADLALELLSPRNMFSFFAGVVWDLKGYEPKPGVITVSTYHKSKGLEWDVVFLTGLNNADFPVELSDKFIGEYWFLKQEYKNPQAIIKAELQKLITGEEGRDSVFESKLENISERARLLYVGITRAKQYLFLSGFHSNQGRRNETLPCKYLLELKKYIDEKEKNHQVRFEKDIAEGEKKTC